MGVDVFKTAAVSVEVKVFETVFVTVGEWVGGIVPVLLAVADAVLLGVKVIVGVEVWVLVEVKVRV